MGLDILIYIHTYIPKEYNRQVQCTMTAHHLMISTQQFAATKSCRFRAGNEQRVLQMKVISEPMINITYSSFPSFLPASHK